MFQTLLSLAMAFLPALATQTPLRSGPGILSVGDNIEEWDLHTRPNPNATEHFVFETVHSLLQKWPRTCTRNGHNIVPGRIPKGTLLYHGSGRNELPRDLDWIAMNPEHSYFSCESLADLSKGCWQFTLMTTRPLKVVYFDGSGSANVSSGTLDTQALISSGKPTNGELGEESMRFRDLCAWGQNFGVDGFVRMGSDFEVMLCDFTAGVSVVSLANIANQWAIPFLRAEMFEFVNSGPWYSQFPGEKRIQLDLSGMVSFYDTQLAPSLVPIRVGQARWEHHVQDVSSEDLAAIRSRLETNLIRSGGLSSGIDWKALVQVIVNRYAERLQLIRYLLNVSTTSPIVILDIARDAQTHLRKMMSPYILSSAAPTDPFDETMLEWTVPIFKLCATTHTYEMEFQFESMTGSEKLLLRAVRTTSKEVCRVVTKMWAAGVYAGVDMLLNTKASPDMNEVTRLRETWTEELDGLMRWLGWSVWAKCGFQGAS